MKNKDDVDPLKSLETILEPDVRQEFFTSTLEEIHQRLADIVLNDEVPFDVLQLFETAKNLSLYSWFVYRFHQVSELVSYSALEMALRERYLLDNPDKKAPTLQGLLNYAKQKKWLSNEKFPNALERALENAYHKKVIRTLSASATGQNHEPIIIDEPSEAEVLEALNELDPVGCTVEVSAKIRNNLAHGSSTLHPGSIATLKRNAAVINQLFN
ncbi:MAG: hypothetical protein ACTH5B_16160 [Marinomonas sp.]|uniref:hypothetical protein n=1 Tax=Marinomonas sp. TaxID=1904862 RepID=UPI003F9EBA02